MRVGKLVLKSREIDLQFVDGKEMINLVKTMLNLLKKSSNLRISRISNVEIL